MSEQRKYERKLVKAGVKLFHPVFGETEAITRNISNGGVFVIVPPENELPQGTELKMQLLESSDPNVIFNMRVVRKDKAGMGLMFINFEANGEQYDLNKLNQFWSR